MGRNQDKKDSFVVAPGIRQGGTLAFPRDFWASEFPAGSET